MSGFETAVLILLAANIVLLVVVLVRLKAPEGLTRLQEKLEGTSTRISEGFAANHAGLGGLREEASSGNRLAREEMANRLDGITRSLTTSVAAIGQGQSDRLDGFARILVETRTAGETQGKSLREEIGLTLSTLGDKLANNLESLKLTVEGRLDAIRVENAAKLEEMRVTVDEKLHSTLEARLGASFTQVNENLERVYKSVGEMQTIASGVGDLKRVLTNVKSRGTWGEVTLGLLLEQVMTPEQYSENVEVRPNSGQRVEYAIKLPGDGDAPLWLPIDAKMPTEDYERLVEASERGDAAAVEESVKGIEKAIKLAARDISTKYICPPHSTDFAIMFLPNEGIYAEVVRRPGLVDTLQREHRVSVAGPTNLMAMLTSFRMGFRTLAIQERSSEVWKVLGNVKHEFGKFGEVLDKVHKKLGEAQNVVEAAGVRRRAVDRQLKDVEVLGESLPADLLALSAAEIIEEGNRDEDPG